MSKQRQEAPGTPFPVYLLYGIPVLSRWPLPQVECTDSREPLVELAEVSEEFFDPARREARKHPPDETELFQHIPLPDGSDYLCWTGLFEFLVSADGRRISGRAAGDFPFESFQAYLLGAVLSYSLLKLGLDPLHSTAVVVDGGAVGFLGNNGYGKSSLGGAFLQAGFPLLTDDLLVTIEHQQGFLAYPGPARIKLFPEIAQALLGKEATGVSMNPLTKKEIIPLRPQLSSFNPVPLRAIYVLPAPGESPPEPGITIRQLPPREAFIQLVANAFNDSVLDEDRLKQHFRLITRLASKIPVKQLSYPRVLDALPALRQAILDDLREGTGP